MTRQLVSPVVILMSAVMLGAQSNASGVIAIVGATVVPMTTNSALLTNHTVIITGDCISVVAPAASTRQIDGLVLRGRFVSAADRAQMLEAIARTAR